MFSQEYLKYKVGSRFIQDKIKIQFQTLSFQIQNGGKVIKPYTHSSKNSFFIAKYPFTSQKKQIKKLCTKLHVFDL